MPHRRKNKHRARHRSQTVKAANLSKPALPPLAEQPVAADAQAAPATPAALQHADVVPSGAP